LCLRAPASLFERVMRESSRLAVTPAAFYLGMLQALLARVTGHERFAVAVPVDTRPHADANDALGFFGVPVPLPAAAHLDDALSEIIRRTDGLFERVLRKGAAFAESLPALVAEGLYRKGAPLVEVFFNYINPQLSSFKSLTVLDAAVGYGDIDLMVIVVPKLGHVRFDFHTDILDEAIVRLLGEAYLSLLDEVCARLAQHGETDNLASWPLPAALEQAARAAKPKSLALAATFAIGQLSEFLEVTFREAGMPVTVAEAPYHQVLASLLDPGSVFAQPDCAALVVLLRGVDLVRYSNSWDEQSLDGLADEYLAAFRHVAERAAGQLPSVVGFLPDASGDARFAAWEEQLAGRLAKLSGLTVLRSEDFSKFYPVDERFDVETDAMGHLPFAPAFVASTALTLTRVVWGLRQRPLKVVAVDGDNTLWGGIAGEIGPEHVELDGARAELARKLLELRSAGVLLVLVSNNDEDTVHEVLKRPESGLHVEHFSAISAGWDAKHQRLSRCASSLGLGLDSFLFLDDNPVEIAAMRAHLPEVMAVTVPQAEALPSFLANLWALDVRAATQEDRRRADSYREEESRKVLRRQLDDFASFVESLRIELEIHPLDEAGIERSVQLCRRTNQFNLRPGSFAGASLPLLAEKPRTEVWTISVRDRFGDYGQVGIIVLAYDAGTVEVVQWMLSCRVLGRGIEERILHWLADRAVTMERAQVALIAEYTPRNIPARRLIAALGGGHVDNQRLSVTLAPERLKALRLLDRGDATERAERGGGQDAQGL
jgi:FkbH-like protein